jgi:hypothetical protein
MAKVSLDKECEADMRKACRHYNKESGIMQPKILQFFKC